MADVRLDDPAVAELEALLAASRTKRVVLAELLGVVVEQLRERPVEPTPP